MRQILWLQWTAGFAAMLLLFSLGLKVGWTSPYMSRLSAEDSILPLTDAEVSWVASFLNLGRFFGAIVGGLSVEYLGSRRTLFSLGFSLIVAWICIIIANSATLLYVARIAAGISLGMAFSSFPLLLGEISNPSIRGSLVSFAMTGLSLGTLAGNLMGPYISMKLFSYISLVPNVIFIILFWWLPESPHYLLSLGKIEDARKSIARYNPYGDCEHELKILNDFITTKGNPTLRERLQELNLPKNRKAGGIVVILYFFMQFSGLNSIMFYSEIIVTKTGVTVIAPSSVVSLVGAVAVVAGWLSIYIADKFPRKVLLIVSSLGVSASMISLGIHFALLDKGYDPASLQWLPITSLIAFVLFLCNGLIPVPNMFLSEVFAQNIKSVAACIGSISVGLFAFIATRTYQPLVHLIGEAYVFWANGAILVSCAVFAKLYLPETKGKSLQEIQEVLDRT